MFNHILVPLDGSALAESVMPFLGALAQELGGHLGPDGARTLMRRLGASIAQSHPLPPLELLPDLEAAMNAVWSAMDWGWVDTGLELLEEGDTLLAERKFQELILARPDDIAGLVAFLCSDWGSFICGQSILVDGGRTLWRQA